MGGTTFAPLPGVRGGDGTGRWPPNAIFTHSYDCGERCEPDCPARVLDEQSGVVRSAGVAASDAAPEGIFGARTQGPIYADTGGASRCFPVFRWEAKAPTSERPKEVVPESDGRVIAHPT